MLNINELESRYKRYKLKSYIPYITVVAGLSIVSVIAFVLLEYKNVPVKLTDEKHVKNTIVHEKVIEKQTDATPVIKVQDAKEDTVLVETEEKKEVAKVTDEKRVLSPSMDFIRKIQGNTPIYYDDPSNHVETKKPNKVKKIVQEKRTVVNIDDMHVKKETETETKKEELKLSIDKKSSINIKRKETDSDIAHVIKRFKNNHNPALSLFVAKKYYQLGEYDKSYNYALITNDINNNIEASWIIFAKSLVKLDKKDEAIKTLEKYIKYSNSSEARILLDEILSGKFK